MVKELKRRVEERKDAHCMQREVTERESDSNWLHGWGWIFEGLEVLSVVPGLGRFAAK